MKKVKTNWFIRFFGLKGSWSWAKKQMLKGKMVKCRHWTGALTYKIQSVENTLLLASFSDKRNDWHSTTHFIAYENYTDYYVVD